MNLAELQHWIRFCLRKKRFDTERAAFEEVKFLRRHRHVDAYDYYCDHCGGHHVTLSREQTNRPSFPSAGSADAHQRQAA